MAGINIGGALLNLLGNKDPRTELVQAALASATPTPAVAPPGPAVVPPVGGAGAPGTTPPAAAPAAPVAPPQPTAYQSSPDLLNLYSNLMDRSSRESRIDNGLRMIAAGFAQPENRAALLSGGSGGGSSGDTSSMMDTVLKLRQMQTSQQMRAQQLQQLPEIAKGLGISLAEATTLFNNEQLDDFITQQRKPNLTTMADGTGQLVTIDQNTGTQRGSAIGATKPRETQVVTDAATGRQTLVYKDTGEPVRDLGGGLAPTDDIQEYNTAVAQGYKGTFEDWQKEMKKAGASNTNVNVNTGTNAALEGFGKTFVEDYTNARDLAKGTQNIVQARQALDAPGGIITGSMLSPATVQGRKMIGQLFGVPDAAVENTETFNSSLKEVVMGRVKALGSGNGITDTDRQFVEQAIGGGNLNEQSIRRIFNILERGSRQAAINYNKQIDDYLDSYRLPDGSIDPKLEAGMRKVDVPELSEGYKRDLAAQFPGGYDPTDITGTKTAIGLLLKNRDDPKMIEAFNAKYGDDAAQKVLEAFGG